MNLETPRLQIRPFAIGDTPTIHRILDLCFGDGTQIDDAAALRERESWVVWSNLSAHWHAQLHQPPYQDMAVATRDGGMLVGAVGYAPVLAPMEQLYGSDPSAIGGAALFTSEVGLFWAIDPAHQGHGYATEAGQALIEYAFEYLRLKRIVATTEFDNAASQQVMVKLGMRLLRNPLPTPAWFQVVGVLDNPAS
jgi:RimJ/RimL family protein N-acetyltransferase